MIKLHKKNIIIFLCLIIILIVDIFLYYKNNENIYTFYNFNNNIDYQVYLNDNNYFNDEYLKSDKQYVSSLINYINVSFDFFGNYSNKINGEYYYSIIANVKITDNDSDKDVYTYKDNLFVSDTFKINNSKFLQSDGNISIDYNKYNNLVASFLEEFDLSDFSSYLTIDIKLYVKGSGNYKDNFTLGLEIPLNKKSFGIEIITSDENNDNNFFSQSVKSKYNYLYIIIFILSVTLIVVLLYKSFKDILFSYLKKFKNKGSCVNESYIILKKYGDFISIIESFDFENYKIINIKNLESLIDIKDILNKPLFMINDDCLFLIDDNNLVYVYNVKAMNN